VRLPARVALGARLEGRAGESEQLLGAGVHHQDAALAVAHHEALRHGRDDRAVERALVGRPQPQGDGGAGAPGVDVPRPELAVAVAQGHGGGRQVIAAPGTRQERLHGLGLGRPRRQVGPGLQPQPDAGGRARGQHATILPHEHEEVWEATCQAG
jgi:hypothetical protein